MNLGSILEKVLTLVWLPWAVILPTHRLPHPTPFIWPQIPPRDLFSFPCEVGISCSSCSSCLAQTRKPFYSNPFVVCPESEYTLCFKENNQRKISESSDIPICSQEFRSNWWCFWDIFQRKRLRNPACFRPTRRCWDISESAVLCSVSLNHSAGGLRFTFACPSQCIPPVITVWRSLR